MITYKQRFFANGSKADATLFASAALQSDLAWIASNIASFERHGLRVRASFVGNPNGVYLERVLRSHNLAVPRKRDNDKKKVELIYNTQDAARKAGAKLKALLLLSKDFENVAKGKTYSTTGEDITSTYVGTQDGLSQTLDYVVKYDQNMAAQEAETSKKNAEAANTQAQADNLNEQTKRSKAVRLTALIATGVLVAGIVALVIVNLTKK